YRVVVKLNTSTEALDPVVGGWLTYRSPVRTLLHAGVAVSAIDGIMIIPAGGPGEGAGYRIDNARIYAPQPQADLTLFADSVPDQWSIWDCCAGSTPTVEPD
ncbi:glycosyl hydrolase family 16, partial [Pseudoalteromonas sp. S4389]